MTAKKPSNGQPCPAKGAVFFQRLQRVGRTRRPKAAARGKQRADAAPIKSDAQDEQCLHHPEPHFRGAAVRRTCLSGQNSSLWTIEPHTAVFACARFACRHPFWGAKAPAKPGSCPLKFLEQPVSVRFSRSSPGDDDQIHRGRQPSPLLSENIPEQTSDSDAAYGAAHLFADGDAQAPTPERISQDKEDKSGVRIPQTPLLYCFELAPAEQPAGRWK